VNARAIGWLGIARLGLVQAALGSIVVLATSTMNRVMVVELALPAVLPGALVGLHYGIQILRPRLGFGSDVGGRRTPWIVGGVATLGLGAVLAALAIALMQTSRAPGIFLAFVGFILIGLGVGAAGTSLLVLLAKRVDPARRAAAATAVWLMMIVGFVVTTIAVGQILDPYSAARLVAITGCVAVVAFLATIAAVHGLEMPSAEPVPAPVDHAVSSTAKPKFRDALAQVWNEPQARRFTLFIFVSMLAYSAQELILEPFAGSVFAMTPGQSTQLSGVQHGGVLIGMVLVNIFCSVIGGPRLGSLRTWIFAGCIASALALIALAVGGAIGSAWPLRANVFLLGMANGAFAVAAIGSMMSLVGAGRESREGVRMGLWGGAQAVAFGLGGFLGAAASDVARRLLESPGLAYGIVFIAEAGLFAGAAWLASRLDSTPAAQSPDRAPGVVRSNLAHRETPA
jgi:BCD family chlorophyll transporter-like MFS transporter